jgi:DNA-binding NtrC family response regulator
MPGSRKRQSDVLFSPVLHSDAMRRVDRVLRMVASKDVTLTFCGESGSGKEVLARRAHELSGRRDGPFIPINCAAIPEALFESELFGHERGAFTGATHRALGKIEAAHGGTLFFDEIGEMPLAMQAKLLRFLENRRFMRVGGTVKLHADVRLLFATLRRLDQEVASGRFRADLFFRIRGITMNVPPLRERTSDIPKLLAQTLAEFSARHSLPTPRLTRRAKALLLDYPWPGNVRELRNAVETVCLLRPGRAVRPEDFPEEIGEYGLRAGSDERPGTMPAPATTATTVTLPLDRPLDSLIDAIVEAALALEQGNRARVASRLGISMRTLQRLASTGRIRTAPRVATVAGKPGKPGKQARRSPA